MDNIEIKIREINKEPTLCLNMIVKNESKIIKRLLESVYSIIDTYCICDTGSTDNTCEIIETFFEEKNIKGKIVKEPFRNFEHNRNFALKSALGMSDYVLLLDADMRLQLNNFNKSILKTADAFLLFQGNLTFFYQNVRIVKNSPSFFYIGVTHEYLNVPDENVKSVLNKDNIFIVDIGDGCCKHDKYERDIKLLSNYLLENPDNDRTLFYLANSYFDNGNFDQAIENYQKRIKVGGWIEEVYYSYYRIGKCYEQKKDFANAIYYWFEAFNYHDERLESIYQIVNYYRVIGKQKLSYALIQMIKERLEKHKNNNTIRHSYLFLDDEPYKYKFDYEISILAFYLKIKNINDEAVTVFNSCYDNNNITNLLSNMKFYKFILKPNIKYNLNKSLVHKINGKDYDFRSSSSCIIPNSKTNGYFMNVRYVNYELIDDYKVYKYDNYILSINEYLELDRSFNIVNRKMIGQIFHDDRKYGGVEDVRIFNDIKEDKVIFIGVGLQSNNNIGILNGDYDIIKNDSLYENGEAYLSPKELKSSFNNNDCEKNWVYFYYKNEIHIIYSWGPLKICSINKENNTIEEVKKIEMPMIFNHIRGSSCGFRYNNEETWFIVHLVSYESPRCYYHLICVFDNEMKLLRYTAPFKFSEFCIEYSLGLIVEKDKIIITNSQVDSTTNISVYSKDYIEELLKYN